MVERRETEDVASCFVYFTYFCESVITAILFVF